MHYTIFAGEASGDIHGAALIKELRKADPNAEFSFFGGDNMAEAAGCSPVVHIRQLAYMGFSEVIRHFGDIRRNMRSARKLLRENKTDALILIDYPSFNLRLGKEAEKLGIPVFYYIPPKVWAWKSWRTPEILRISRRIFTIFPFEPEFYNRYPQVREGQVIYAGNPSVEEYESHKENTRETHEEFLLRYRLRPNRPLIALMPGSRMGEIRKNLPVMLKAVDRFTQYKGIIIGAPGIEDSFYASLLEGREIPVLREESAYDILPHCRGALVTSGTATLEVALAGVPQVALYRSNGSKLAYNIMSRILKVPFVTLPNLIAGREIIPEKLLHECTPDTVADALAGILRLQAPGREAQTAGYAEISRILTRKNAPETAAREIVACLSENKG